MLKRENNYKIKNNHAIYVIKIFNILIYKLYNVNIHFIVIVLLYILKLLLIKKKYKLDAQQDVVNF